jgi:hypothetical protein
MRHPIARPGLIACALALLCSCEKAPEAGTPSTPTPRPLPTAPPRPTPVPTPTPIYVPSKRMETGRMFSGVEVHATVQADFGSTATIERDTPSSYVLDLQVAVKVPRAHSSLQELSVLNPALPTLLPGLPALLEGAQVSPFYQDLYARKVATINHDLVRLDQLISRHNFFDCETLLTMKFPKTGRRVVLLQADMDVVMDGSDSDRVPLTDGSSANFEPTTSYKWPKQTAVPNPFLAGREANLKRALALLANPGTPVAQMQQLQASLPRLRAEVDDVKRFSYLVSTVDPFVVLPGPLLRDQGEYAPKLGDYCVVVAGDKLYPAIVGDVGPTYKVGEASLRLSKAINAKATAYNRPVDELKASYFVFPGTAEKPFSAPNLDHWFERCQQLLNEIGGYQGELVHWTDLTKPTPTPTPVPTATPEPAPSATPALSPVPSPTSLPSVSPKPSATASASPGVT